MLTPTIFEIHRHGQADATVRPVPQTSARSASADPRLDDRPIAMIGARYCVGHRAGVPRLRPGADAR